MRIRTKHGPTAVLIGLALIALVVSAIAGTVYQRVSVTLTTTAGTGSWTMPYQYSGVELKRVWVEAGLVNVNTITVQRVTSDLVYTQACGSVVTAAKKGNTATFTAAYLKYGDKLIFTSTCTTGSVVLVDHELQKL